MKIKLKDSIKPKLFAKITYSDISDYWLRMARKEIESIKGKVEEVKIIVEGSLFQAFGFTYFADDIEHLFEEV